jgi:hypothetical protein
MRTGISLFCIIVLAFCAWLLMHHVSEQAKNNPQQGAVTLTNHPPLTLTAQTQTLAQSQSINASTPTNTSSAKAPWPTAEEFSQQALAAWQAPIEFYGKVVDENTNPIEGVSVLFQWDESATTDVAKTLTAESDSEGLFSLQGKHGRSLEVSVSKEGYYSSQKDKTGYMYALTSEKFLPSKLNPVVFHLHKKGQGVDLITSQYGIRPDFPVLVPRDGNPVNVDLLQRKTGSGDLEISQVKPDSAHWNSATNWSFQMSFPNGGFIETDDAFLFAAPETGYQPTIDFNFVEGGTNWLTQFSKDFYIMFGQPPKYGWLHVDANMMQQTVVLKYAINPTGSQNLEPK